MGRLGTEREAKIFKVWWGTRAKVNPYQWIHAYVNVICSLGRNRSLKDVQNYIPYQSQEAAQEPARQESENWPRSQETWSLVPSATRLLNKSPRLYFLSYLFEWRSVVIILAWKAGYFGCVGGKELVSSVHRSLYWEELYSRCSTQEHHLNLDLI